MPKTDDAISKMRATSDPGEPGGEGNAAEPAGPAERKTLMSSAEKAKAHTARSSSNSADDKNCNYDAQMHGSTHGVTCPRPLVDPAGA
jgi:hypothetical protein